MATEWIPLTRFEPRSWALANGEIIQEPPLEQTSTGRKIRVVGTKNSFFANNIDVLLWDAAQAVAREKNTTVVSEVLPTTVAAGLEASALDYRPRDVPKAKAHMVHNPGTAGAETKVWWRFKHPALPVEAVLSMRVMQYPWGSQPSRQIVTTRLATPMMVDGRFTVVGVTDSSYQQFVEQIPAHAQYKWREFFRDTRPKWGDQLLANNDTLPTAHKAVKVMLDTVRSFEELETLQIPDFTNLDEPGWMELELYETNVNAEFLSDLTEWVDSNPAIDGILNAYQNLLDQMALSGFSVNNKKGNEFMAALLSGDKASMHMTVTNALDTEGRIDGDHAVSVHLPTGTLVVECTHRVLDRGEAAEKWEEAVTIAKMTGQEDVLLEYARRVATDKAQGKAKKVIRSRN